MGPGDCSDGSRSERLLEYLRLSLSDPVEVERHDLQEEVTSINADGKYAEILYRWPVSVEYPNAKGNMKVRLDHGYELEHDYDFSIFISGTGKDNKFIRCNFPLHYHFSQSPHCIDNRYPGKA